MANPPKILGKRSVCASRLFQIDAVSLRFSNGEETEYERIGGITAGNAVMIVPLLEDGRLLFINEYSVGTERYETVFPKGRIDAGEQGRDAAQRELREETGFRAEHLTLVQTVTVMPGYASFATQIWLARDLHESPLPGDEPESMETIALSVDDALAASAQGTLTEARTILAVYLVRDSLTNMT